jgi:hypothetical protein
VTNPHPNPISATEYALISTLACIVLETMDYSPAQRLSTDSYLPPQLIELAQQALAAYGKRIQPCKAMINDEHATSTVDVGDGSGLHDASSVEKTIVKD